MLESSIYELIRQGIPPAEIAKRQEYRQRKSTLKSTVGRLAKLGFVEKVKVNRNTVLYIPKVEQYITFKGKNKSREQTIKLSTTRLELEPYSKVEVTNAMSQKIYYLSKSGVSRRDIASQLNMPVYLVNRERIAMGVDTKA